VPRTLFISDLHLDTTRPATVRALADYLARNRDCEALYILGDLFEAWPGDDDDSTLSAKLSTLLREFTASGPRLYIMQGNRDFLLGQAFCQRVGASWLPDPTVIDLYGQPTLLMHGDSLCTADTEYQEFRKKARDPQWQSELLQRSLAERRELASNLRSMSTEANSNKAEDIMDVTPSEVAAEMQKHGVKQMIHGHTHRPARHEEACGLRWVLGDWDAKAWYIEADSDHIDLYNIVI